MIKFIHAINQFAARSVPDINGVSLLARLIFTGVFVGYFWSSTLTKLGDGFFGFIHLSAGAYIKSFPKQSNSSDTTRISWALSIGSSQ